MVGYIFGLQSFTLPCPEIPPLVRYWSVDTGIEYTSEKAMPTGRYFRQRGAEDKTIITIINKTK